MIGLFTGIGIGYGIGVGLSELQPQLQGQQQLLLPSRSLNKAISIIGRIFFQLERVFLMNIGIGGGYALDVMGLGFDGGFVGAAEISVIRGVAAF